MSVIKTHPDWINPGGNLIGVDGNAFGIIAYTQKILKKAGNPKEVIDAYIEEAQSGNYEHLLQVSMAYCGMFEPLSINERWDIDDDEWDE